MIPITVGDVEAAVVVESYTVISPVLAVTALVANWLYTIPCRIPPCEIEIVVAPVEVTCLALKNPSDTYVSDPACPSDALLAGDQPQRHRESQESVSGCVP